MRVKIFEFHLDTYGMVYFSECTKWLQFLTFSFFTAEIPHVLTTMCHSPKELSSSHNDEWPYNQFRKFWKAEAVMVECPMQ